ncbi:FMN-binding protein [Parvularcula marina]
MIESQTADVANVSGATYTADAYLASLQSALDAAGA